MTDLARAGANVTSPQHDPDTPPPVPDEPQPVDPGYNPANDAVDPETAGHAL